MKRIFTLFLAALISASMYSQSPGKFSYQAVVRNAGGVLVQSTNVRFRISVLQGSSGGTAVYVETHLVSTNTNGLATLEVGNGVFVSGVAFSSIDWSAGPYFLKTETDPTGGTSYTIFGTSELVSVPYALLSKRAGTADYNSLSNLPVLNIANWNTAFSWGNHASSGYLTSYTETDPVWSSVSSNYYTKSGIDAGFAQITHTHADATITVSGLMSGTDKTKLNGLQNADGSETKVTPGTNVTVNGTGTIADPYIVNANSSGWSLNGNAGTVDGTDFIGTSDNAPINLKVNNQKAGKIDNIGIALFGYQAGNNNTAGYITGIGYQALSSNTTGGDNTEVGAGALQQNTTGEENTSVGQASLNSNNSGIRNTAIGSAALQSNSTGHFNTAIGRRALSQNSEGSGNTAVGVSALGLNLTGNLNTALGHGAGVGSVDLSNSTVIGANAVVNESNAIQLGDNLITKVYAGTGITATLIAGGLQITGGTPSAGKVLTSDAAGVATWQAAGGGGGFIHYIGELYGGGIVVAVWKVSGVEHGLIASYKDLSVAILWTTPAYISTTVPGGAQSPFHGLANTNAIVAQAGAGTTYAAGLCDSYTNLDYGTGIYSDWYLPANWELNQCYHAAIVVNTILGDINGFQSITPYWSSTEIGSNGNWAQSFTNGSMVSYAKNSYYYRVRAVRSF